MLLTVAVTVATLYFAQEILIPLALAVLLAFLLGPSTRRLEKAGLGRLPAVLVVVATAFAIIGSLAWVVGSQAVKLAEDLPAYQSEIVSKWQSLHGAGAGIEQNITDPSCRRRWLMTAWARPCSNGRIRLVH
jgi:predicted PurR-regulated permease PerM